LWICDDHCLKHFEQRAFPTSLSEIEKFKGSYLHSHSYRDPKGFEDKKVLVVGIGNSGGDISVELSRVAKQVILFDTNGVKS